jgi:hypothetical protein
MYAPAADALSTFGLQYAVRVARIFHAQRVLFVNAHIARQAPAAAIAQGARRLVSTVLASIRGRRRGDFDGSSATRAKGGASIGAALL